MQRGQRRAAEREDREGGRGEDHEARSEVARLGLAHACADDALQDDCHRAHRRSRRRMSCAVGCDSCVVLLRRERTPTRCACGPTLVGRDAVADGPRRAPGGGPAAPVDRRRGARVGGREAGPRRATSSSSRCTCASPTATARCARAGSCSRPARSCPCRSTGRRPSGARPGARRVETFGGAARRPALRSARLRLARGRPRGADDRLARDGRRLVRPAARGRRDLRRGARRRPRGRAGAVARRRGPRGLRPHVARDRRRARLGGERASTTGASSSSHRSCSPARLLPATSLFSVLGDFPSAERRRHREVACGAAARRPRERGRSGRRRECSAATAGSARRSASTTAATAAWGSSSGARTSRPRSGRGTRDRRAAARPRLSLLDRDRDRRARPSGRPRLGVALGPDGALVASRATGWEVAGAVEASSTPVHRYETNALVRVARTFEPFAGPR